MNTEVGTLNGVKWVVAEPSEPVITEEECYSFIAYCKRRGIAHPADMSDELIAELFSDFRAGR